MVKIDKHISELLLDNECVIVPKMGAFLISHSVEGIHSQGNPSVPAAVKLSFNDLIDFNDGLLASHIVKHEKLAYSEALKEIEKFVFEFHQEVDSGKKFIIERVGVLYKDERSNVRIESAKGLNDLKDSDPNDLIESAAIRDLQSIPTSPNEFNPEEEKQPEIPFTAPSTFPPQQKFVDIKRRRVLIFVLLSVSILAFGLYYYFSRSEPVVSVRSEVNPENEGSSIKLTPGSSIKLTPGSSIKQTPAASPLQVTGKGDLSKLAALPADPPADPPADIPGNNYFIIAGSFKSIENAKRKLDELKLQGFVNAQIFSDVRKLQLVCYDRFNSIEEAQENMNKIKMHYKDAWIYSR